MSAQHVLRQLTKLFAPVIQRTDIPTDRRLFLYVEAHAIREICRYVFRDLDARYVVSIGLDDRPVSGKFLVAHNFAFDREHVLCSILTPLSGNPPRIESIADLVPAANWSEREFRDLVGIEPVGHPFHKRLILPDGWPDGVHPLRKDYPWDLVPSGYDETRSFAFDEPPEGCTVVPFGPFHPTLDEPAHFRLYVEGETVRGCEYRGFMVHRAIEKLGDSVLTYNEIPMAAERICGFCGFCHFFSLAYVFGHAVVIGVPLLAE